MNKLRHIEELAVSQELYKWFNSPAGRKYWEEYARQTAGMNAYQYCMFLAGELKNEDR